MAYETQMAWQQHRNGGYISEDGDYSIIRVDGGAWITVHTPADALALPQMRSVRVDTFAEAEAAVITHRAGFTA